MFESHWVFGKEFYILNSLIKENNPIFFDVGASRGEWATMAKKAHPNSSIHSFEMNPLLLEDLEKNLSSYSNIHINKYGLSNKEASLEFLYHPDHTSCATLITNYHDALNGGFSKTIGQFIAGDQYCQLNNIDNIDYLKIDTEGAEPFVLMGFENMFSNKKIKYIQFEYGKINMYSNYLMKWFYEFFEKFGYTKISKIQENGLLDYNNYKDLTFDYGSDWLVSF